MDAPIALAPSRAPDLASRDGLSPLERATRQPLMLGLFLPIQNGGWTPSDAARDTDWSFDYNARLIVQAEEAGFDLAFGLAQWLGAHGHGGRTNYRQQTLDPLLVTAGAAALTRNIILISTVHVLYGVHPLHLAKASATLHHMSRGRCGLNLVTGYRPNEFAMFGLPSIAHDERYTMAEEFTEILQTLWRSDSNLTYKGKYWQLNNAFASPTPVNGRPIMVNASASEVGLAYGVKHSDLIFITSPGGADIDAALRTLPALTKRIKQLSAAQGRQVRTIINPHVICRDTEAEVKALVQGILDGEDAQAVDELVQSMRSGDNESWRGHQRRQRIVGGNVHVFGTPEQVVEQLLQLKGAGCDGVQINFFDYEQDLRYFTENVLPLLKQAGLRID
jgi:FMNH2-dependent dimethyl sulfone monooxygenase